MPELPEVETMMRGLKPVLEGQQIERVLLRRKDLRFPFPKHFALALQGAKVERLERRSKYMLWHVVDKHGLPQVVLVHLGMSGRFTLENIPPTGYAKHDHIAWFLQGGKTLIYNDPRRFGIIDLCEAAHLRVHPLLSKLGPEPLEKEFNVAYLMKALAGKTQAIKPALMDAVLVVGVGNIYASEACFLAQIHPEAVANDIATDRKRVKLLVEAIKQVLQSAIESGGSSLKDFWHVDGGSGYFQHQFNVYGRKNEGCRRCDGVISQITQTGRSSFFCSHCQEK